MLQLSLRWLKYQVMGPQNCDTTFVEIYDRTTAESDRRKINCGNTANAIKSSSNHVYVRAYAKDPYAVTDFQALFTVFSQGRYSGTLHIMWQIIVNLYSFILL